MGRAIAARLLASGSLEGLALTDISGTRLSATVETLQAIYPAVRIVGLRGDVTVEAEAKAFAGTALDVLGGIGLLVMAVPQDLALGLSGLTVMGLAVAAVALTRVNVSSGVVAVSREAVPARSTERTGVV